MSTRPSILWITTDQQRWDTLDRLGNGWVRTPRLDRLSDRMVETVDPLPVRKAEH